MPAVLSQGRRPGRKWGVAPPTIKEDGGVEGGDPGVKSKGGGRRSVAAASRSAAGHKEEVPLLKRLPHRPR